MPTIVTLLCLVNGDSIEWAFAVDISKNKLISHLKDEIKKKKENDFRNIDADNLTLWKVDIPDDDEATIQQLALQADTANEILMWPTKKISKYFRNGPM